ncbi:hypothetical protein BST61_g6255 [Cercospora zeina]
MATPTSNLRELVVTGATGKQGGALIQALLAQPTPTFEIYAITRNKSSPSAQRLLTSPNIHLIEGDFSNPTAIFSQIKNPWGLFSVTIPTNATKEETQGKAMTTAALSAGIKHIIFTSTDRGGPEKSSKTPTSVPHFASKFHIEQDILQQTPQYNATYTFLRPVAFFENLSNDFLGRERFVALWRRNHPSSQLQFISTRDIGLIAARAFLHHTFPQFQNRALSLAGDSRTLSEAETIFQSTTGTILPETYPFVAKLLQWLLHEQLGKMFDWFEQEGFGVDVEEVRKEFPFLKLKGFGGWLEGESAWRDEKK